MSERAREIASKIISEVWPTNNCQGGFIDEIRPVIEAAVEKHMLQPHQMRDSDGEIWEQLSNKTYARSRGQSSDLLNRNYGPLTEVQGSPLPDVAALKAKISELERKLASVAKPHQIHDRYGRAWEQSSDGLYRPLIHGVTPDKIDHFSRIAYDRMAECGEIERLKARIAELESVNHNLKQ